MGTPGSNNVLLHFMCVEHQARTQGRRETMKSLIEQWETDVDTHCGARWDRTVLPLPVRNTNIVTALPSVQTIIGKLQPLLLATREQCRDHVYIRRLTWEINETFEGLLRVVCDHSAVLSLLQIILPHALFISHYDHLYQHSDTWQGQASPGTRPDQTRAEV